MIPQNIRFNGLSHTPSMKGVKSMNYDMLKLRTYIVLIDETRPQSKWEKGHELLLCLLGVSNSFDAEDNL